jgi:hypothetical protein
VRRALPLTVSLLAAALLWPSVAAARPFSPQPDDKPWTRGTLMPSFGLGGSFYRGGGGNLLVAAGLNYFVVNNLALGLQPPQLQHLPAQLLQAWTTPGSRSRSPPTSSA